MSRLALYKFPPIEKSTGKTIIKYLSEDEKIRLYTFKICCDKMDRYLPKEMWKLIVYHMCDIKRMLVNPVNIFNFMDKFISDSRQIEFNPIVMGITKASDYYTLRNYKHYYSFIEDIDISYEIWDICRNVQGGIMFRADNMFHIRDSLPERDHRLYLLVGIVQDPMVNHININIGYQHTHTFNLLTKDLHKFTLDNVYSHTVDDLVEIRNNYGDLYDKKYKQKKSITCWSYRNIMPLMVNHNNITFDTDTEVNSLQFVIGVLSGPKSLILFNQMNGKHRVWGFPRYWSGSFAYKAVVYEGFQFTIVE